MKKKLILFLAVLVCVAFVSCGRQSDGDAVMACYNAAKKLMDAGDYDAAKQMIDEAISEYGDGALLDSLMQKMEPTTESRSAQAASGENEDNVLAEPTATTQANAASEETDDLFDMDEDWSDVYRAWEDETIIPQSTQRQRETTRRDVVTTTRIAYTPTTAVSKSPAKAPPATVPTTGRTAQTQPSTTVSAPAEKDARQQALDLAKDSLKQNAISRSRMIEQLQASGLSEADAVYAADHCGADWNVQAFKAAKTLAAGADSAGRDFSRDELIQALQLAGFSDSEASYAADRIGIDRTMQTVQPAQE